MKKAIALLTTLVVMAGTTFAQLAPTMTGSAETKFGYDLDNEGNGFEVSTDVTVTVPVVTATSKATEGEGATGVATIDGSTLTFTFGLDSFDDDDSFLNDDVNTADSALKGTDASISAKLDFANGLYVTIGSDSDLGANFAEGSKKYWVKPTFDEKEGVSLGYDKDMVAFELTIANEADGYIADGNEDNADAVNRDSNDVVSDAYEVTAAVDETTTPTTKEDGYLLGATASFDMGDILKLSLQAATNATAQELADSAKKTAVAAKVESTPVEGLTVTLPVDFLMADAGNAFELLPTVAYEMEALTVGADFHMISVAKELDGGVTTVAEDLNGYTTMITIDGVDYYSNGSSTYYKKDDIPDYVAAVTARDGLTENYLGTKLNVNGSYDLGMGTAKLTLGSNLADTDNEDLDLETTLEWTAEAYSAKVELGDVLSLSDNTLGIDGTFTGVEGVSVTAETSTNLDTSVFALDKLNVDFADAFTGLENTVVTVNYSGFNTDGGKGTAYAGVKISL